MKRINVDKIKNILKKIDLRKTKLKKKYILIIIGALVLGLILTRTVGNIQRILFKGKAAKESTELEVVGEAIPVKVYKARLMSFKDTLPVMGAIKGFKEIDLKFETNGILES